MSKVTCPHCLHHFEPTSPRTEAGSNGKPFYTPEKPCKACGTSLRYTRSGNCVLCHSTRKRAKTEDHKRRLSADQND